MEKADRQSLLQKAIESRPSRWADFGSGNGAFTLTIAELGGPDVEIYSIEKNAWRLREQEEIFRHRTDLLSRMHFICADFLEPLDIPPQDGIIFANSLHFVENKVALLRKAARYLAPHGRLVVVEYDTAEPSVFVPYPLPFAELDPLIRATGNFTDPQPIGIAPAKYFNGAYSALMTKTR